MTNAFASEAQAAVWAVLQRINAAWLAGALESLDDVLHEEMVLVPPGFTQRIEGAAACAEGYREFARTAVVESYEEHDASVDVCGDTAVVTYRYALTYTLEGSRYQDTGRDLYVFAHRDGRWQACWRTLMPEAAER